MKARYLGNPSPEDDGPRRVGFAGKSFPRGVFVDVSDVAKPLVEKLKNNQYFEVSEDDLTAADLAAAEDVNGGEEAGGAAEEHSGEGGLDKAGAIAELEKIQVAHPDFKFNPRAGLPKLLEALESARFEYGDE